MLITVVPINIVVEFFCNIINVFTVIFSIHIVNKVFISFLKNLKILTDPKLWNNIY